MYWRQEALGLLQLQLSLLPLLLALVLCSAPRQQRRSVPL